MSSVDLFFRIVYRIAYQLARLFWMVFRPTTHGALIVVWRDEKLLLVRNSYLSYYCLPGGYVRGGETPRQAAVRELLEETKLSVLPAQLKQVHEETHDWEFRRDHVTLYAFEAEEPVQVEVDHREVVSADFWTPEQALSLKLFPPLRRYLENVTAPRPEISQATPSGASPAIASTAASDGPQPAKSNS